MKPTTVAVGDDLISLWSATSIRLSTTNHLARGERVFPVVHEGFVAGVANVARPRHQLRLLAKRLTRRCFAVDAFAMLVNAFGRRNAPRRYTRRSPLLLEAERLQAR
jgi:hypothetical protein